MDILVVRYDFFCPSIDDAGFQPVLLTSDRLEHGRNLLRRISVELLQQYEPLVLILQYLYCLKQQHHIHVVLMRVLRFGQTDLFVFVVLTYREREFGDSYQFRHFSLEKIPSHDSQPMSESRPPSKATEGVVIAALQRDEQFHLELLEEKEALVEFPAEFLEERCIPDEDQEEKRFLIARQYEFHQLSVVEFIVVLMIDNIHERKIRRKAAVTTLLLRHKVYRLPYFAFFGSGVVTGFMLAPGGRVSPPREFTLINVFISDLCFYITREVRRRRHKKSVRFVLVAYLTLQAVELALP